MSEVFASMTYRMHEFTVHCKVEPVGGWGQRNEPPPQTPVWKHPDLGGWAERYSEGSTPGIYLGNGLVLIGELKDIP